MSKIVHLDSWMLNLYYNVLYFWQRNWHFPSSNSQFLLIPSHPLKIQSKCCLQEVFPGITFSLLPYGPLAGSQSPCVSIRCCCPCHAVCTFYGTRTTVVTLHLHQTPYSFFFYFFISTYFYLMFSIFSFVLSLSPH